MTYEYNPVEDYKSLNDALREIEYAFQGIPATIQENQWQLLETITPDDTEEEYDITWDEAAYDEIRIELVDIQPNIDRGLLVRLGITGGTVFFDQTGDYAGTEHDLSSLVLLAQPNTSRHRVAFGPDSTGGNTLSGRINIIGGSVSSTGCIIDSLVQYMYGGAGGTPHAYHNLGFLDDVGAVGAIDTVKLYWDGAPATEFSDSGLIRVYGLKNS